MFRRIFAKTGQRHRETLVIAHLQICGDGVESKNQACLGTADLLYECELLVKCPAPTGEMRCETGMTDERKVSARQSVVQSPLVAATPSDRGRLRG